MRDWLSDTLSRVDHIGEGVCGLSALVPECLHALWPDTFLWGNSTIVVQDHFHPSVHPLDFFHFAQPILFQIPSLLSPRLCRRHGRARCP
jgi:hypothetical protein